jgi:hypothetical protein
MRARYELPIVTKLLFQSALVGGSERRGSRRERDLREQLIKERSGEDKSSGRVVVTPVVAKAIDASNFINSPILLLTRQFCYASLYSPLISFRLNLN